MIVSLKKYVLAIYNSYHISIDDIDNDFYDNLYLSDLEVGSDINV